MIRGIIIDDTAHKVGSKKRGKGFYIKVGDTITHYVTKIGKIRDKRKIKKIIVKDKESHEKIRFCITTVELRGSSAIQQMTIDNDPRSIKSVADLDKGAYFLAKEKKVEELYVVVHNGKRPRPKTTEPGLRTMGGMS